MVSWGLVGWFAGWVVALKAVCCVDKVNVCVYRNGFGFWYILEKVKVAGYFTIGMHLSRFSSIEKHISPRKIILMIDDLLINIYFPFSSLISLLNKQTKRSVDC